MKNIILFFSSLVILTFSLLSHSQTPTGDKTNIENLTQQGQLFTVNIIPGDKLTTIKIVGKKAATLKFDKLKIQASLFFDGKEKTLEFQKEKNSFTTKEKLSGELNLKILGERPTDTETFKFKLDHP